MNIFAFRNMISMQWKPKFRIQKPPLIGLTTTHKKLANAKPKATLQGISQLYIGEISCILNNCQLISQPPNNKDTTTKTFI